MSLNPITKRNQSADLLKGMAVIFMVQVHIMELFAKQEIYDSVIGKISLFIGGPPCAPVFMAVMGYFLAYSDKPFSYYAKRGAILFIGGILLNIGRSAYLFFNIYSGQSIADPFFYIFGVDILPLAGLSLIACGLLKLFFKHNYIYYLIFAFIIAAVSPYLPVFGSAKSISGYVNAFLWGNFEWSYFPLFPWLAYILIGYAFRLFEKKYQFSSKFGSSHNLVFSIPLIVFAAITISYATNVAHNLNGDEGYYHHEFLFFCWVLLFMAGYIMVINLIEEHSGKQPIARFVKWIGKNVTVFYVFQWLIIGNIGTQIYKTQSRSEIIFWFIGIIAVVSVLTFVWSKIKKFYLI
ncbi:MAG: DUF1624 domain-containing protein [Bacteroidetes bacterium]|nr:DUF1624 domain-containing protein [Bacteroidota bacterium]